ncbi:hypothetical protein [Paenibacillus radicis (ex Xue et al. 2023)]|uniref:DUF1634 domain-containing protein n=1 Tax=Paenibacillus radicis (ex Xue et al. 2023) TaxID=2972489 RepID=A0ABT1YPV7_9BACL|nr:hypothetical protein [Paenibacillus radicis (ex Xue et al. 2023)]MCR8634020.1 hypothetical protein [Paenibacillus radicis (ex Xue et al. 2023)]
METEYEQAESQQIKETPQRTETSKQPRSGEAVAAMAAVVLGMAALTAAHWWSAADAPHANPKLLQWGSWLPNGHRIGPFAGKQAAALVVWLTSWLILLPLLMRFDFKLRKWTYAFATIMLILLILLWPPVYHALFGWPA